MNNMTKNMNASRREFLRTSAALSFLGGAGAPFALNLATLSAASAQTAVNDYKALVCVFLYGGNDSANMLMATDPTSWGAYTTVRTTPEAGSIALPAVGAAGGVLPITPITAQAGRSFALHPSMGLMRDLFDGGRAALVANTGPLIAPLNRTQYRDSNRTVPVPPKLFSHNDQQSTWQAFSAEGARVGWGGRMGDLLAANNGTASFTCISTSGNAVYLAGRNTLQYQVGTGGAVAVRELNNGLFGSNAASTAYRSLITKDSVQLFEKEHAAVVRRALDAQVALSNSMAPAQSATVPTGVPNPTQLVLPSNGQTVTNGLATQLQTVARIMAGRSALSMKRQVFFVSMGGFDTHDNQKNGHSDLMARLSHAFDYFDKTLGTLQGADIRNQVTTFTASDFGRTFTSNGDGTDHGWGSHHWVSGGAVKGKDIYGAYPVTGLGHDQDAGSGSLIPTTSVDQYAATLARWFGLSDAQLTDIFPNLGNFGSARNLGFMV
jgi:uncharacterized protein (DUF1501 family)